MTEHLLTRKDGRAGRITLSRPRALNALSYDMVRGIHAALDEWRGDDSVDLLIIDGEGEKAFCAGGDVAQIYHAAKAGDHQLGARFFRDEYRMNAALADYEKPIVSFMQGYVMGGGVGVGGHVSHRVVGASTRLAMPECAIGMIPDVGGTWLLGRAPGRVGEYLGLTGARIEAADAIFAGFADLYIPEAEWPGLIADLCDSGDADLVRRRAQSPGEAPLETRDLSAFGGRDPAEIIARLEAGGDGESAEILRRASPMSLAVTLLAVRAARGDRSIQQSLARELRYTARATRQGEFLEGVRAQIIDKDRRPNWRPAPSADEAAALLAPLQSGGLDWD